MHLIKSWGDCLKSSERLCVGCFLSNWHKSRHIWAGDLLLEKMSIHVFHKKSQRSIRIKKYYRSNQVYIYLQNFPPNTVGHTFFLEVIKL